MMLIYNKSCTLWPQSLILSIALFFLCSCAVSVRGPVSEEGSEQDSVTTMSIYFLENGYLVVKAHEWHDKFIYTLSTIEKETKERSVKINGNQEDVDFLGVSYGGKLVYRRSKIDGSIDTTSKENTSKPLSYAKTFELYEYDIYKAKQQLLMEMDAGEYFFSHSFYVNPTSSELYLLRKRDNKVKSISAREGMRNQFSLDEGIKVEGFAISPDTERICYFRETKKIGSNRLSLVIQRRLKDEKETIDFENISPSGPLKWAPDGEAIIFSGTPIEYPNEDKPTNLYIYYFSEQNLKQLTYERSVDYALSISPDSKRVSYFSMNIYSDTEEAIKLITKPRQKNMVLEKGISVSAEIGLMEPKIVEITDP